MVAILGAIFKMAAEYILNVMKWLYILADGRSWCIKFVVISFSKTILNLEVIIKYPDGYSGGHVLKLPP